MKFWHFCVNYKKKQTFRAGRFKTANWWRNPSFSLQYHSSLFPHSETRKIANQICQQFSLLNSVRAKCSTSKPTRIKFQLRSTTKKISFWKSWTIYWLSILMKNWKISTIKKFMLSMRSFGTGFILSMGKRLLPTLSLNSTVGLLSSFRKIRFSKAYFIGSLKNLSPNLVKIQKSPRNLADTNKISKPSISFQKPKNLVSKSD